MRHFCAQNGPFAPNKFFLGEIINIILIYLLAPFLVQNFKKILTADPELRMHNFWAQNDPFPQTRIFSENLLKSVVSFIQAYLHAKNQSQISIFININIDINISEILTIKY